MKVLLRTVLFFDALFDLALGAVLLLAPFDTFYAALQLPQPQPALYGQLLGLTLLGVGWLLAQAAFRGELTVPVARMAGPLNLACAVLLAAWLVFLELPVQGVGRIWLALLAAMLAIFALIQIPLGKRVRTREREALLRGEAELAAASRPGAAPVVHRSPSPEVRREPVITPPPGYGPGTEVVTDVEPVDTPIAPHHARQNPHP